MVEVLVGKSTQVARCNGLLNREPQKGSVSSNLTFSVSVDVYAGWYSTAGMPKRKGKQ
jgi:hypothetical protein